MFGKPVLITAAAICSALLTHALDARHPKVAIEYTVGADGVIRHGTGAFGSKVTLSKEYSVGDIVDQDGPAASGGIGVVDGTQTTFNLTYTPIGLSAVSVYVDGLHQRLGLDYNINGKAITFAEAPAAGSTIDVQYRGEFVQ